MPLFFGPGNNSFARCIKNCSINKNQNQEIEDPAQYISTTGNPTITYPGNDYIVYTFTEPYGEFFSSIDLSVNVVIVGGGGGGGGGLVFSGGLSGGIGGSGGGGGGAGEVINLDNVLITNNNNNVINVGNGGAYGNGVQTMHQMDIMVKHRILITCQQMADMVDIMAPFQSQD